MKPRASRMADITASVPELTSRTTSTEGTAADDLLRQPHLQLGRARRSSCRPSTAACTASSTAGCACPRIIGPHEPTKSMYSFPSASTSRAPCARG